MRQIALFALLCCIGCKVEKQPPPTPSSSPLGQQALPPSPPGTLDEVKRKLAALEDRMGPDAFSGSEAKELLDRLSAIPTDSPDYTEASTLANLMRAKMRIAQQALSDAAPRDDRPIPRSYGPKPNAGATPSSKDAIHLAESTRAGNSREELLQRYGSCIVRQTWFKGQDGRPSTELYQTAPDCRDKLKPRIFRVADSRIEDVSDGEADSLMKPRPRDERVNR